MIDTFIIRDCWGLQVEIRDCVRLGSFVFPILLFPYSSWLEGAYMGGL